MQHRAKSRSLGRRASPEQTIRVTGATYVLSPACTEYLFSFRGGGGSEDALLQRFQSSRLVWRNVVGDLVDRRGLQ